MYILVHMNTYYPSILHFETKEQAEIFMKKEKLDKDEYDNCYIAKVEHLHTAYEFNFETLSENDIEWSVHRF